MKQFYFSKYESRRPYRPVPASAFRSIVFQFLSILMLVIGSYYIYWRWAFSLNFQALWFSVPLILAETFAFFGTALVIFNFWSDKDPEKKQPVIFLSDIEPVAKDVYDRPLKIDVLIATYNEDVELVRYSIRDAKKMRYPYHEVEVKIYVLDDGCRDGSKADRQNMKAVAEEEGVAYLCRDNNTGFKAGNLKNALEQTDGDLFVILDADTRPFPGFLENTTGYFRDKDVAWVQTPQWFYDLTEPKPLAEVIKDFFGKNVFQPVPVLNILMGKVKVGADVFGNDSQIFYDVIMRKRNYHNAAFCCGAGSIHRRAAIFSSAENMYHEKVVERFERYAVKHPEISVEQRIVALEEIETRTELRPFVYHASEDIYTSLFVHADRRRKWRSIQHPEVECKMLSPQDIDSWVRQRTRYASGSLDIAIKNNPLTMRGLSLGQRINYFQTIYSYFAPIWILALLLSPIVFYFALVPPINAFNFDFFKIFIPYQILSTAIVTIGCWGIPTKRAEQYYIAGFWVMLKSMWKVLKGERVQFNVTQKSGTISKGIRHIIPHFIIIGLTVSGFVYNIYLMAVDGHPSLSGFAANTMWAFYNVYNLSVIILAALWTNKEELNHERQRA